jgi:uncharacterized SAM-binding protein YcdF (DUF218 family)
MSDLDRIFVVLGYGCHLTDRVRGYLEHAASSMHGDGSVITTGGRTAEVSAPGVSEAAMMAEHLRVLGVKLPIELEETARTTVENLRNVSRMISERGTGASRVVIFCDRARQRKIAGLARYFLKNIPFDVEPYDLRRTVTHTLVQSTVAVPFDLLCARIHWLERLSLLVVERRMRRS